MSAPDHNPKQQPAADTAFVRRLDRRPSWWLRGRVIILAHRLRPWWNRIPATGGSRLEVALLGFLLLIVAICALTSTVIGFIHRY